MNISGAEKKLRQASFFLAHLQHAPREIMRRGANPEHQSAEQLEFHFSACLSAAKSAYYVLYATGGATFNEIQRRWRAKLPAPDRWRVGRMMGLRDDDVHEASTPAEPMPKYIPEEFNNPYSFSGLYGIQSRSALVELENPDGTRVSGPVLRGTTGLYIEQQGRRVEAADACREFIQQLRSLVDEAKASLVPEK